MVQFTKAPAKAANRKSVEVKFQKQFLKTTLCMKQQNGTCRRGQYCKFAHSLDDIRERPCLDKTRLCAKPNCDQINCKFAHSREELTATSNFAKTKVCHFGDKCMNGDNCRYAHAINELAVPAKQKKTRADTYQTQNMMIAQQQQRTYTPPRGYESGGLLRLTNALPPPRRSSNGAEFQTASRGSSMYGSPLASPVGVGGMFSPQHAAFPTMFSLGSPMSTNAQVMLPIKPKNPPQNAKKTDPWGNDLSFSSGSPMFAGEPGAPTLRLFDALGHSTSASTADAKRANRKLGSPETTFSLEKGLGLNDVNFGSPDQRFNHPDSNFGYPDKTFNIAVYSDNTFNVPVDGMFSPVLGSQELIYTSVVGSPDMKYNPVMGSPDKKFSPVVGSPDKKFSPVVGSPDKKFSPIIGSPEKKFNPVIGSEKNTDSTESTVDSVAPVEQKANSEN